MLAASELGAPAGDRSRHHQDRDRNDEPEERGQPVERAIGIIDRQRDRVAQLCHHALLSGDGAGGAGVGGPRRRRAPKTIMTTPPPRTRNPTTRRPMGMARTWAIFTPAEASTATPALPSGCMVTICQSPLATSQVRVCGP